MKLEIIVKDPKLTPQYGTQGSAGADLKADIPDMIIICPNERVKIPTGVFIALPDEYKAAIRPRSSVFYQGLMIDGTIDSDYRGEIMLTIWNVSKELIPIHPYERLAQLIVSKVEHCDFVPVKQLPDTARGEGGYGHTGKF